MEHSKDEMERAPVIQEFLDKLSGSTGGSRNYGRCATCPRKFDPEKEFKTDLARREYNISRCCQKCQDTVFDCKEEY